MEVLRRRERKKKIVNKQRNENEINQEQDRRNKIGALANVIQHYEATSSVGWASIIGNQNN